MSATPLSSPLPSFSDLLRQARSRHGPAAIARFLGQDAATIKRWDSETRSEAGTDAETDAPLRLREALHAWLQVPPGTATERGVDLLGGLTGEPGGFRFIDLFAGIGGIRLGFEAQGGTCVFTSEWNTYSQQTYRANHGDLHPLVGDIVPFPAAAVPDHEVLLGGFPCQPFSIAGVSKKNALGRPHGFEDATQGTLFFDVARIIAAKRPRAFLLENVKNLLSHDGGNTLRVILSTLRDELGYEVHHRVIDGQHFTPQHRERILLVGFDRPTDFSWDAVQRPATGPRLASILHKTDGSEPWLPWDGLRYFDPDAQQVPERYTLTPTLWRYLQDYADKHRAAGNGFGFGLVNGGSVTRTLSARYHKDGSEILVDQGPQQRPRRLTPRECARLMGFPDSFRIPVSDTQAYRQFGNSVVMPVMREVARVMRPYVVGT